jgi:hypothetical protein
MPRAGDVGGHQRGRRAGGERGEVPGARVLRQVAVQLDRRHALLVELAGHVLRAVLGAREDDRATGCGGQVDQHRDPRVLADVQHVVGHGADRRLRRVDAVRHGVGQVALHQDVDTTVERGGEQHPLAAARRGVEQALHAGQEAEVGHVVGLVEHGDLHRAEVGVTAADVVLEPARARDHDVDAVAQAADLATRLHAAEDGDGAQAEGPGQRGGGRLDLGDQLTRGRQDQRAGWPGRRLPGRCADSRASSGSRNAYVLPEPVRPRPSTSRPRASREAWRTGSGTAR